MWCSYHDSWIIFLKGFQIYWLYIFVVNFENFVTKFVAAECSMLMTIWTHQEGHDGAFSGRLGTIISQTNLNSNRSKKVVWFCRHCHQPGLRQETGRWCRWWRHCRPPPSTRPFLTPTGHFPPLVLIRWLQTVHHNVNFSSSRSPLLSLFTANPDLCQTLSRLFAETMSTFNVYRMFSLVFSMFSR